MPHFICSDRGNRPFVVRDGPNLPSQASWEVAPQMLGPSAVSFQSIENLRMSDALVTTVGESTLTCHAVFGVKQSLIADFKDVNDLKRAGELGLSNPFKSVEQNFVLSMEK